MAWIYIALIVLFLSIIIVVAMTMDKEDLKASDD